MGVQWYVRKDDGIGIRTPTGKIEVFVRSAEGFNINRRGQIHGSPLFKEGSLERLTQSPIRLTQDVSIKVSHVKSSGNGLEIYVEIPNSYRRYYIKQTASQ